MTKGACLCGKITWEFSAEPEAAYHCHCSMCRKAHGAAFGTYYWIKSKTFNWTGSLDSLVEYSSSPELDRAFCRECGSVVPNPDKEEDYVYVPAGSHTDGPPIDEHIMVGSKAPWYDISDSLQQHEIYPPEVNLNIYPEKTLSPVTEGEVRGSCLCGAVEFKVTEPFKKIYNCHCSRCRRARAAAFTTNGFVSSEGIVFEKGEDHIHLFELPEAKYFTQAFCDKCGSGLPRIDPRRGIAVVPLGSLDDDPGSLPAAHIFAANKAEWFEICGELSVFDALPSK